MDKENSESGGASVAKTGHFFAECREELRKVVKPTKDETVRATGVTVFIILFVSLVLCFFDIVFSTIMTRVFHI